MADRQRMIETVRALYAKSAAGDWDGLEALLGEDFVIIEPDGLPYGGSFHGRRAVYDMFHKVMGFWADPAVDLQDVTAGDEYAYGVVVLSVTSRATGRRLDLEIAERFRFKGDKIVELKPYYFDTHAIQADLATVTG